MNSRSYNDSVAGGPGGVDRAQSRRRRPTSTRAFTSHEPAL